MFELRRALIKGTSVVNLSHVPSSHIKFLAVLSQQSAPELEVAYYVLQKAYGIIKHIINLHEIGRGLYKAVVPLPLAVRPEG